MTTTELPGRVSLPEHGIDATGRVYPESDHGAALHARARARRRTPCRGWRRSWSTPASTPGGRPKDKFIVREPASEERIWWGEVNATLSEEHFDGLREKVTRRLGDAGDALRRRRVGRRRPGAPHRRARRDCAPVPRAVREARCSSTSRRASATASSRRRWCCTRPSSRPIPQSTGREPGRSSCCTRRAARCSSAGRSTRARSRSRSSPS